MIRSTIVLLITFVLIQSAPATPAVSPHLGLSQPIGAAAHNWAAGYTFGLDYLTGFHFIGAPVAFRADFHRWEPNADELLRVGDRNFKMEYKEGWNTLTTLSVQLNRHLADAPLGIGSVSGRIGFGLGYFRSAEVTIKGFAPIGNSALVRYIYHPGESALAPLLAAEISLRLPKKIHLEPSFRIQHLFHDAGFTILSAGLNLLPRE